ncbi:hypothetical protein SEA_BARTHOLOMEWSD_52 [Streptomyces phage BartholomewSD]|nr:hypothetical protein SEA_BARTHOLOMEWSD_52 [Streptomyces phage BartholomewSD]
MAHVHERLMRRLLGRFAGPLFVLMIAGSVGFVLAVAYWETNH